MTELHDIYFHAWHWLFQMVQLGNWVGNIVAGVITFITLTIVWPKFRHVVERAIGVTALHKKLDAQHTEKMTQAERHHQEKMAQAERHHKAQLAATRKARNPE
ncbi:MAG: hypothetical protein HKL85_01255 [Acidimicrobiaceae bacterium]|nr:hypothetical protein [Acidimicrobiaceae bacterium]